MQKSNISEKMVANFGYNTTKLDQIGLKRSASCFLIWKRISGDMGRSDNIPAKEGKGK